MGQFSPAGLLPGSSHYYKQVYQLAWTPPAWNNSRNTEWRKQEGEEGKGHGDSDGRGERIRQHLIPAAKPVSVSSAREARQGFTCFRMDIYVHNNAFDEDGDNIVIK